MGKLHNFNQKLLEIDHFSHITGSIAKLIKTPISQYFNKGINSKQINYLPFKSTFNFRLKCLLLIKRVLSKAFP